MHEIDKSSLPIVTSSKLYLDAHFEKIDEDGLLSERIFGPMRNFKCKCGKLSFKRLYEGQRCNKCNVLCDSNSLRYTTFAKIVDPYPLYKQSPNCKTLLQRIIPRNERYLLDTKQADRALKDTNYLKHDIKTDKLKIVKYYDPTNTIPLCITGGYSFYLALLGTARFFQSQTAFDILNQCFDDEILVIPPSARFVSTMSRGATKKLTKHPINDLYCRLLRMCQYDWKTVQNSQDLETFYLDLINKHIGSPTPIEDDNIKTHDLAVSKHQFYYNEIYNQIIDIISGKEGIIRKEFIGKTIDFSMRCHIIVNPSLQGYEIIIPKKGFIRLWFIEFLRYLFKQKDIHPKNMSKYIKSTESTKAVEDYSGHIDEFISWYFTEGNIDYKQQLVLVNRQPTLYRYGIPAVKVINVNNHNAIEVSPLLLEAMNADFDGDTFAVYKVHSKEAQEELNKYAFYLNTIKYDHKDDILQTVRLEAYYSAIVLLNSKINKTIEPYIVNNLQELPEIYNADLTIPIENNNLIYSYGLCLFNKWCGFTKVQISSSIPSNEISKILFKHCRTKTEFHSRITELNKQLYWFSSTHPLEALTLSLNEIANLKIDNQRKLLKKLPDNPYIGQHIYEALVNRIYDSLPKESKLYKLTKVKFNRTQLSRMVGSIGFISDDKNIIYNKPLSDSVFNGLDENTFFLTALGTRKGVVDKSKVTPSSGYLERKLCVNLSPIELENNDCGTKNTLKVKLLNKRHILSFMNRFYIDENGKLNKFDHHKAQIGEEYNFRSAIYCESQNFHICKTCFGHYENISSPYIGIIAGQSLSERSTQLSMRTFHTSGSCSLTTQHEIVQFIQKHLIDIYNYDHECALEFNTHIDQELLLKFQSILGFNQIDNSYDNNKILLFYKNEYNVVNEDVTKIIKEVSNLLNKSDKNIPSPEEAYIRYIEQILSVGEIYSTFVELVLCNNYVTVNNKILRYDPNSKIKIKLNIGNLHKMHSRLLGLLLEPNSHTVEAYADSNNQLKAIGNSVLENLWSGIK